MSKKCEHDNWRHDCRECSPHNFCEHGGYRRFCRVCSPHNFCEHERRRNKCAECNPRLLCAHGKWVRDCPECSPQYFCKHARRKTQCGFCDGKSIYFRHLFNQRSRGLTNELTETRYRDLAQQLCLFCGEPAGGVDRVKNEYGYTVLNSVSCCWKCNSMKGSRAASEFIAHANTIAAYSTSYEQFKSRWINTRTTGPDLCPSLNIAVPDARSTSNSARASAKAWTASTAEKKCNSNPRGQRGSNLANMEREERNEGETAGHLSHSSESKVDTEVTQ